MGARDAHAAGFRVQAGREVAKRVDPATDPVLALEDDDVVALTLQLERGDEAGQPRPDDDDAFAVAWAAV